MATVIVLTTSIIATVSSVYVNVYSNQIVSINQWEGTGNNLLGFSAYGGAGYLKDEETRDYLVDDLGVNTAGYGQMLSSGLFPDDDDEAWSCCRWKSNLVNYISSGKACDRFAETWHPGIWSSDEYKAKGITSMIYLKENCGANNEPSLSHCYSDNESNGTPKNDDGWWTELMVAFVECTLEQDPDMNYFHIWNEPNAAFSKDDEDGYYYVDFYYTIASAIKDKFPDIEISGPVTWCPPIHGTTWEEWFASLIDKMVDENREDLLDYIDFHAYTTWDDDNDEVGNNYARWDHVLNSINAITGYYYGKTNGGWIRSLITETNVHVSDYTDDNAYWKERVIENAKQIMALSFARDKIELRHQFDLGADSENLDFFGHDDEYMQDVMKVINDGYPVQFEFDSIEDGYPKFDNGVCFMTQTVYDKSEGTINVIIINYCNGFKDITIKDVNSKITWDDTARFTRRWGPNTIDVSVSGYEVTATLKPLAVTVISGSYKSNPGGAVSEYEFIPSDETKIMQILGGGQYDDPTITVTVDISGLPSGYSAKYAYIKFGLVRALMYDFKWTITVTMDSTTYFTIEDYVPSMEYNEFRIEKWGFLNGISNGKTVTIKFVSTRTGDTYKWAGTPGRFVFASLVTGNGGLWASFSNEEETVNTALSVTVYVAIIIFSIVGICVCGFGVFWCIRRRKMKNAVSFEANEDTVDTPKLDKERGDETMKEATTGRYDMSPINDMNNQEMTGKDEEVENEDADDELEVDVELELDDQ